MTARSHMPDVGATHPQPSWPSVMGLPEAQHDGPPSDGGTSSILRHFLSWARPGITLRSTSAPHASWRMREVLKAFLCGLAMRLHTSDGTLVLVGRHWSKLFSPYDHILRHVRSLNDILCGRAHDITMDSQGMRRNSVLFSEPAGVEDKTSWSLFAYMLRGPPSPRS